MYNIQRSVLWLYSFLYLCVLGGLLFYSGDKNPVVLTIFNVVYYSLASSFILQNEEYSKIQHTIIFIPSLICTVFFFPNLWWIVPFCLLWIFAVVAVWFFNWRELIDRILIAFILISSIQSILLEWIIPEYLFFVVAIVPLGGILSLLNTVQKEESVNGFMQLWLWISIGVYYLCSFFFDVNIIAHLVWFWSGVLVVACILHLLSPNHRILTEFFFSHFIPTHSIQIFAQKYFGLDFRGLWTARVLQKRTFALLYTIPTLFWLSSSFGVVPSDSVGIRENFGTLEQSPLATTGLQVSLPYPFGYIHTIPSKRVLSLTIGHEEETGTEETDEQSEGESILWADQHAEEEFTLLLGDGKDLISADGIVMYQIRDPYLYLERQRDAEEILEMLVYRALMMETSSRRLEDSLSENIQKLSQSVYERVLLSSQEHQLGIVVIDVTLVALHPPVAVAEDYQDVVSAQILSKSAILHAQASREQFLPQATSNRYTSELDARGEAKKIVARARGEAAAFLALQQSVEIQGELYKFEAQHRAIRENLRGRRCTIVDHRIEQDGASLWINKQ